MRKFEFANENDRLQYVLEKANDFLDSCPFDYRDRDEREYLIDNIEISNRAKQSLRDIFSKCEGWNGNDQVVLPTEFTGAIDTEKVIDFCHWVISTSAELCEEGKLEGKTFNQIYAEMTKFRTYWNAFCSMRDVTNDEVVIKGKRPSEWLVDADELQVKLNKIQTDFHYIYAIDKYVDDNNYNFVTNIRKLTDIIRNNPTQFLDEETANDINDFADTRATVGAKLSRTVQKTLNKLGFISRLKDAGRETEWRQQYAIFADAVNPLKVKRWTIISINFVDFLTMSNGYHWTACTSVRKDGRDEGLWGRGFNSRRVLDYAQDPTTFIVYTVKSDCDGDEFELQPKLTRQLFHFGYNKLIQSRLYPQVRTCRREVYTQYREIVQRLICEGLGEYNSWSAPSRGEISPHGDVFTTPYEWDDTGDFIDFSTCASHGGDEDDPEYFAGEVNWGYLKSDKNYQLDITPMMVGSTYALDIMTGDELGESYHNAIYYCD